MVSWRVFTVGKMAVRTHSFSQCRLKRQLFNKIICQNKCVPSSHQLSSQYQIKTIKDRMLTPSQRSYCMSRIRGKNTKPEILVRKGLHARGFRFRLQDKKLPGKPDIVLPKYGVVIMVNGCFWHGHKGCRYATVPKSNVEFWTAKIERNRHLDQVTEAHLLALGWHVITVWECELRGVDNASARIEALVEEIKAAGLAKQKRDEQLRQSRQETQQKLKEILQRQVRLEAEINALYPVPARIRKASLVEGEF